jgi:type I thyroxine 5'-deiodinase
MAKFDRFCQLAVNFADLADFLCVYIEEAHPSDGWAFSGNIDIRQHKTLDNRMAAAQILAMRKPPFPVVVDSMADEANTKYGGLFERLYVFRDDVIEYQGGRGPSGCLLSEVEQYLVNFRSSV